MPKISLRNSVTEFKVIDSYNRVCANMSIYVHAYTCTYVSSIFINGRLNLGWIGIFPIDYNRKVDKIVEEDCKGIIAMKEHRVKAGSEGKCYQRELNGYRNQWTAFLGGMKM